MAMITINGVALPGLSTYKVDTEPIGSFERNANGKMVGDLVAIKTKLNCTWDALEGRYVDILRSAVAPFYVTVTYLDIGGMYSTKNMYTSPMSASLAFVRGGITIWKGVTANLIEV